jgi:hypothetical protein
VLLAAVAGDKEEEADLSITLITFKSALMASGFDALEGPLNFTFATCNKQKIARN